MTAGEGEGRSPAAAGRGAGRGPLGRAWQGLEEGALCVLLVAMVAITFVTVTTRYVLDLPLSYIDQLVPNLFVWVTFLGAPAAAKRYAHLGLSLLHDALPPRGRAALEAVALAGTAAFFLVTAWFGGRVVQLQLENHLTTSLGYPAWLVGLAVPVGSVLFVIRAVEAWLARRRDPRAGDAAPIPID